MLAFDGKGVAMGHEDLRPATQAAAAGRNRKLEKRLAKGEKRATKGMSQVGAVYTIEPFMRGPDVIIGDLRPGEGPSPTRPRPEGKRACGRAWRKSRRK